MEAKVYNLEGKGVSKVDLPESIFGLPANPDLVHQVVVSMQSNERSGTAHAKTRAEVRGGGRKPWRQKGTGRARHGSIRSPIWVGGGVAHGPTKEKSYFKKINRKMKLKALLTILSAKLRDGEIIFVENLPTEAKTKTAKNFLDNLAKAGFEKINYQKGRRALILTALKNDSVGKGFANIGSAAVEEIRNLNPLLSLSYKYLILEKPAESLEELKRRLNKELALAI